jgi:tRNA(His) 5'-end guanylyltransferase
MKKYEYEARTYLPENSYNIIRLDGKAFGKFTKQFNAPFDDNFTSMMDATAIKLCQQIQGAVFAYVQSDEISILVTDVHRPYAQLWFNGQVQKITSVSASIAAGEFNRHFLLHKFNALPDYFSLGGIISTIENVGLAAFDSLVFTAPSKLEAYNAFLWRQMEFKKNSVLMVAQNEFPHKVLLGKNTQDKIDMLMNIGINWNNLPQQYKTGRIIIKQQYEHITEKGTTVRTRWVVQPAFCFEKEREQLLEMIPNEYYIDTNTDIYFFKH